MIVTMLFLSHRIAGYLVHELESYHVPWLMCHSFIQKLAVSDSLCQYLTDSVCCTKNDRFCWYVHQESLTNTIWSCWLQVLLLIVGVTIVFTFQPRCNSVHGDLYFSIWPYSTGTWIDRYVLRLSCRTTSVLLQNIIVLWPVRVRV